MIYTFMSVHMSNIPLLDSAIWLIFHNIPLNWRQVESYIGHKLLTSTRFYYFKFMGYWPPPGCLHI